jgi:anti-sigma factor RsiW
MADRYDEFSNGAGKEGDCPYAWISEWLCEYVDGTMDPSMEAVFEEYMEANPELAEHVKRLCHTRTLLSECDCDREAPDQTKARLRAAAHRQAPGPDASDAEALEDRVSEVEAQIEGALEGDRSRTDTETRRAAVPLPRSARAVAAAATAMTLMLSVGVAAGAMFFAEPPSSARTPVAQTAPDRASRSPARAARSQRVPGEAALGWATPLPLGEMPARAADTAQGRPAASSLLQRTDLNLQPRP